MARLPLRVFCHSGVNMAEQCSNTKNEFVQLDEFTKVHSQRYINLLLEKKSGEPNNMIIVRLTSYSHRCYNIANFCSCQVQFFDVCKLVFPNSHVTFFLYRNTKNNFSLKNMYLATAGY